MEDREWVSGKLFIAQNDCVGSDFFQCESLGVKSLQLTRVFQKIVPIELDLVRGLDRILSRSTTPAVRQTGNLKRKILIRDGPAIQEDYPAGWKVIAQLPGVQVVKLKMSEWQLSSAEFSTAAIQGQANVPQHGLLGNAALRNARHMVGMQDLTGNGDAGDGVQVAHQEIASCSQRAYDENRFGDFARLAVSQEEIQSVRGTE
jgi:hypothetical protein